MIAWFLVTEVKNAIDSESSQRSVSDIEISDP